MYMYMYFDHESLDDLIGTSEKYVHVLLYNYMHATVCEDLSSCHI